MRIVFCNDIFAFLGPERKSVSFLHTPNISPVQTDESLYKSPWVQEK